MAPFDFTLRFKWKLGQVSQYCDTHRGATQATGVLVLGLQVEPGCCQMAAISPLGNQLLVCTQ